MSEKKLFQNMQLWNIQNCGFELRVRYHSIFTRARTKIFESAYRIMVIITLVTREISVKAVQYSSRSLARVFTGHRYDSACPTKTIDLSQ